MKKERLAIGLLGALLSAACFIANPVHGATRGLQTQEVGQPLARFSLLKPVTQIYLRYKIVEGRRESIDIWRRQISFEEHDGRRRLHIYWRWDSVGEQKFNRTEDFWFETETFRPLTVERRLDKDGKTTVQGYRYLGDRIEGLAQLPNNEQKDFVRQAKMPAYNWETDMELFQALPLAAGYEVRIPFYEAGPGEDEPQYYKYKVVGADRIASTDGHAIDCWVVETEPTDPNWSATRFWFAKDTQVMLREEATQKDGAVFVKILLPFDAGNERSWNRAL